MDNGFQFIDIIFFAMIAVFLVLRLRGALGRRDNEENGIDDLFKREQQGGEEDGNIIQLPERPVNGAPEGPDSDEEPRTVSELDLGIQKIRELDPTFTREDFLVGARVAFEMVLNAYASGDVDTLKNLLSPDVYSNFAKVIQDREQAGHTMEDTLVGIQAAEMLEAYLEGRVANITIKFITDQINITRDDNGDVVDGNPNEVITVTDFWTFAHDSKSRDPNWTLVATRSLD